MGSVVSPSAVASSTRRRAVTRGGGVSAEPRSHPPGQRLASPPSSLAGKCSILEGVWGMLREWSAKVGKKQRCPSFIVFELDSCCRDSLPFFVFCGSPQYPCWGDSCSGKGLYKEVSVIPFKHTPVVAGPWTRGEVSVALIEICRTSASDHLGCCLTVQIFRPHPSCAKLDFLGLRTWNLQV